MSIFERPNNISWEEYFMQLALLTAKRSKDPTTKVGACIVNNDNKVIGLGYNGFVNIPDNDKKFPWDKHHKDENKNKYAYVVHAEVNAILNATMSVKGCTIYVTHFPCRECTKLIIQSGIRKVVYLTEKTDIASEKMLYEANAIIKKFEGGLSSMDNNETCIKPALNNSLTYSVIKTFLKAVKKTAYLVKTPEEGYRWETQYETDKVLLSYTNGEESYGVYLDIVNNKCINHDSNHDINLCKVAETVLHIIMEQ